MTDPARDLLVLLHGRGADETDLLPIAREAVPGAEVLAPRAPVPFGSGYAWAEPDDDVAAGRGLIAAARDVLDLVEEAGPARRRLLLGFSQGAGVAVEVLRLRPDLFEAVVLLSGFVPRAERLDPAVADLRPRVFWGRGELDPLLGPEELGAAQRWLARCTRLTARVYPGLGHGVHGAELVDVAEFLTS